MYYLDIMGTCTRTLSRNFEQQKYSDDVQNSLSRSSIGARIMQVPFPIIKNVKVVKLAADAPEAGQPP
jgi:hypothetical protein